MSAHNIGRCNYCERDAVVRFSFMSYLAASRRKWWRVWVRACAEHEGCANWNGHLAMHPDAKLERRAA